MARKSTAQELAIPGSRLAAGVETSGKVNAFGLNNAFGLMTLIQSNYMANVGTIYLLEGTSWKEISHDEMMALPELVNARATAPHAA